VRTGTLESEIIIPFDLLPGCDVYIQWLASEQASRGDTQVIHYTGPVSVAIVIRDFFISLEFLSLLSSAFPPRGAFR